MNQPDEGGPVKNAEAQAVVLGGGPASYRGARKPSTGDRQELRMQFH
jgi:hypothetical protein